jgi:hypothetical protein
MLLHFTILQANIIGAPKGKALAKGSSANLQNHDANTPTASGTGIGNAVAPQPDSVLTVPAPKIHHGIQKLLSGHNFCTNRQTDCMCIA